MSICRLSRRPLSLDTGGVWWIICLLIMIGGVKLSMQGKKLMKSCNYTVHPIVLYSNGYRIWLKYVVDCTVLYYSKVF